MGGGAWLSLGARSARAGEGGARAGHARWMTSRASTGPRAGRCGFRAHMYTCDVHTQYANTAGANWRDPLLRLLLIRVLRCAIRSFYYDRGRSRAQLQSRNGDVSRGPATRTTTYRYRDWDSEVYARSRLVSYRAVHAESFAGGRRDNVLRACERQASYRVRLARQAMGRPGEGRRDSAGWGMGEREDSWKCARAGFAAFAVRIAPFRPRTIAWGASPIGIGG